MLMIGPARPELPPHVKEGLNEAVGRPNQRSTPRRNPRSHPGARRREERGRQSEPGLFTFIIYLSIYMITSVPSVCLYVCLFPDVRGRGAASPLTSHVTKGGRGRGYRVHCGGVSY